LKPSTPLLQPTWSQRTDARLLGLSLAREAGLFFAWDAAQRLYLWNVRGESVARQTLHFQPCTASISDDASRIVVAGEQGDLWWLDQELRLKVDLRVSTTPLAVALDTLGHYLAISGDDRRTHLFHRGGKELGVFDTPRPLAFLHFSATEPRLITAADYGFVATFDPTGRCLWRDTPLVRVGSLCIDGHGACLLLACYSTGIVRYDLSGSRLSPLTTPQPCRLARSDFQRTRILAAGEGASLTLLKPDGQVLSTLAISANATALVLGALGDYGAFGLADGTVTFVEIGQTRQPA
jgi:hypothetical protein